jgi:hypothetical protein
MAPRYSKKGERRMQKNAARASKEWHLVIDEDPSTGDAILTFPPELLKQAGWEEGDSIQWIDNYDGTWSLVKEEDLTNFIKKGIIKNEQN